MLLGFCSEYKVKVAPKISTVFVSEDSDCFLFSARYCLVFLFLMSPKFVQIKEQGVEDFFSSKINRFYNHSFFDYKMALVCVIGTLFFDGSTVHMMIIQISFANMKFATDKLLLRSTQFLSMTILNAFFILQNFVKHLSFLMCPKVVHFKKQGIEESSKKIIKMLASN